MDETPSYIDTSTPKTSKKKTIWLILIIVALIASNVSWALFFFKQQGELNTKISILTAKNLKLEKDNKSLEEENDKNASEAAKSGDYREIPELGVKYKLTDETETLTYSYSGVKDNESISWSSIALSEKSTETNGCNSYDGTVIIWSKSPSEISDDKGKKVGDQTIYRITPDGGDSLRPANCRDEALLEAARTAEKTAYDSLQPID